MENTICQDFCEGVYHYDVIEEKTILGMLALYMYLVSMFRGDSKLNVGTNINNRWFSLKIIGGDNPPR